jgi:hypothetical protein
VVAASLGGPAVSAARTELIAAGAASHNGGNAGTVGEGGGGFCSGLELGGAGGSLLPHVAVGRAVMTRFSSFTPSHKLILKFQNVISSEPLVPGA